MTDLKNSIFAEALAGWRSLFSTGLLTPFKRANATKGVSGKLGAKGCNEAAIKPYPK